MTKLTRPICFFDIESTGTEVATDRILTLAITKLDPNGDGQGSVITSHFAIAFDGGGKLMDEDTIAVHGITNEQAALCPPFSGNDAHAILAFIFGSDIAGFNCNNFDVPMLWEEMHRVGVVWDMTGIHVVDVGNIFKKKEERSLTAAVKFYCDREHKDAHGAAADVQATIDVLTGQMVRYADLAEMDVPALAKFSTFDTRIDLAGKFCRDADGDACYNFKHRFNHRSLKGVKVKDDPGLARWMQGKDFTANTFRVINQIFTEIEKGNATGRGQGSLF